jgi:Tol biopolymer transport system component
MAPERTGPGEARPEMNYFLTHLTRRSLRSLHVVLAAIGLVAGAGPPALAAFPGENGRIAYGYESHNSSGRNSEQHALITVQPDGNGAQPLKRCYRLEGKAPEGECSMTYRSPAYSPDGARLAFDAGSALALMYSDGSAVRLLNPATSDDGEPAWSPTGRRLVFTGTSASGQLELWVWNLSNGEARQLTDEGGRQPAWSSRNRIAFTRGDDVYTIRPDGSGLRRLTRRGGLAPTWSPHGTKLAFVRDSSIYVIRAKGGRPRRLGPPEGIGASGGLAWSPDGTRIAFENSDCFEGGISIVRLDRRRSELVSLAGNWCREFGAIASSDPDWQPLR